MTTTKTRTTTRGLTFNQGSHQYRLDGQHVPGVTTILGCLDKPAIPKWAAATVAEYVATNPDAVETLRGLGEKGMIDALKNIPWKKRDDAGTRGQTLHDVAEGILHDEEIEVDDDLVPVVENAIDFMTDWQISPILIEAPVASRTHRWAGTLDLIAVYTRPDTGHRGIGLFDWKSGKALYPEYAWQFSAYGHAEFTGLNGDEHELPPCDAAFGVHIRPDGYDVHPFAYGPDIYQEFLAIRHVYDIVKAGRGDWKTPGSGHVGIAIRKDTAA
jgi:hypothetical protein